MFLRTEISKEKKLIGMRKRISFVKYTVYELWRNFMPRRNEIKNINTEYISLEVYNDVNFFSPFNPASEFEKWAAVEVADYNFVPEGMETLTVPSALYAVFLHKGTTEEAQKTYGYIFTEWLPKSDYVLDNRPHFAVMGAKYKNNDPESEEEIWVPVKKK